MKEKSFEEAMLRLQEIVDRLESGEESLESSMKLFEEGAKLSALCYEKLKDAEQKIAKLSQITEKAETANE